MADTTIVGRNVGVSQTAALEGRGAFSWGAVVAGALAAVAVTFILLSLGSGIGFLGASPYSSGPSVKTLTVLGAMWIVLSQAWGYAVGGYLAGRLRTRVSGYSTDETNFRDGAHGFIAWALGVVLTVSTVALGSMFGVGLAGHIGATVTGGAAAGGAGQASGGTLNPNAYYVDTMFRAAPGAAGATAGTGTAPDSPAAQAGTVPGQTGATFQERGEAIRMLGSGLRDGKLADEDRAYLARLVQARTGLSQEEANRRVDETVARVNQAAKDAADKAAKAASYFAFWSFMALLIGAAAATVGGIVGGNHRDEWTAGTV